MFTLGTDCNISVLAATYDFSWTSLSSNEGDSNGSFRVTGTFDLNDALLPGDGFGFEDVTNLEIIARKDGVDIASYNLPSNGIFPLFLGTVADDNSLSFDSFSVYNTSFMYFGCFNDFCVGRSDPSSGSIRLIDNEFQFWDFSYPSPSVALNSFTATVLEGTTVPEASTGLALVAFGILGGGSTLLRKKKQNN